MDASKPIWQVRGTDGTLECGPLVATVSCSPDGAALVPKKWNGAKLTQIEVLGGVASRVGLEVVETYIRGNDLVTECAPAGPDRIAPHLYYRASRVGPVIRIELVLSMRTELLDSSPIWTTSTFADGSRLLHADCLAGPKFEDLTGVERSFLRTESIEQLFVFRVPQHGFSYAEMVHPSDFHSAVVNEHNGPLVAKLFPERLEKGVIRRARVCGWFMPAENDLETAVELARRFVDEPLPLTT